MSCVTEHQGSYLLTADGTRLLGGAGGRGYSRPPAEALQRASGVEANAELVSFLGCSGLVVFQYAK